MCSARKGLLLNATCNVLRKIRVMDRVCRGPPPSASARTSRWAAKGLASRRTDQLKTALVRAISAQVLAGLNRAGLLHDLTVLSVGFNDPQWLRSLESSIEQRAQRLRQCAEGQRADQPRPMVRFKARRCCWMPPSRYEVTSRKYATSPSSNAESKSVMGRTVSVIPFLS